MKKIIFAFVCLLATSLHAQSTNSFAKLYYSGETYNITGAVITSNGNGFIVEGTATQVTTCLLSAAMSSSCFRDLAYNSPKDGNYLTVGLTEYSVETENIDMNNDHVTVKVVYSREEFSIEKQYTIIPLYVPLYVPPLSRTFQ